jgi:ParB-like chromosome segregation protein Spo0J
MSNSGRGQAANAIEQVDTATLIPYARNARTHSEQQVAQIAGSIQEFGFNNPVLIDAENGIIAGHGRVMAANLLKLERVPCIRLAHLSDAQKRAFILADNRIALNSGWDTEMLANELSDLHADEIDLGLMGFDADELATMIGLGDEEPELPDMPETTSHTVVVRYEPDDREVILRWLGMSDWSEQGLGKKIIERIRDAASRN